MHLDKESAKSKVNDFIKAYNALASTMSSLSSYNAQTRQGGPLLGDSILRAVQSQIRQALSNPVQGVTGVSTLAEIGIKTNKSGVLELDATKLDSVIASSFDAVSKLFASTNGLATRLDGVLKNYLSSDGALSSRVDGVNKQIRGIVDQQDKAQYQTCCTGIPLSQAIYCNGCFAWDSYRPPVLILPSSSVACLAPPIIKAIKSVTPRVLPVSYVILILIYRCSRSLEHNTIINEGSQMNAVSAMKQYQQVSVHSGIMDASPHRLVQMLMEGVLEKIALAKGNMANNNIASKGENISKAIGIIGGLKSSLNKEVGGALAENLSHLYDYMANRLVVANLLNDENILDEVAGLMAEIKMGWDGIPDEFKN